jgi:hypothetical protein
MSAGDTVLDEAAAMRKWQELSRRLDRMMERVGTAGEFPVGAGSSLRGDDAASDPYQVSQVIQFA